MYKLVEAISQDVGAVDVRRNDYLLDCFESDVTIKVPRYLAGSESLASMITINIEVDGPRHKQQRTKSFCERRDKVLQAAGIHVARLDIKKSRSVLKDRSSFEKWLRNEIATARKIN